MDWYRPYPTGYTIFLKSVYEIPVGVGCTVHMSFRESKLTVTSYLFFIGDDLRSWWIEERHKKLEIGAQKKDLGFPNTCYEECMYRGECT